MKNECKKCQYAAICLSYSSKKEWINETQRAGVRIFYCASCGKVKFNKREMLPPPCGWDIKPRPYGTKFSLCINCSHKERLPLAKKIKADLNELADSIERLADVHEVISQSRLKEDAIVLLLQKAIGSTGGRAPMPLKKIQAVLDALPELKKQFVKPQKKKGAK